MISRKDGFNGLGFFQQREAMSAAVFLSSKLDATLLVILDCDLLAVIPW